MSQMGTERTPPQINAHYSKTGEQNFQFLESQLRKWNVPERDIQTFNSEVVKLRRLKASAGQMEIFNEAAHAIQVNVHWIH